MLSADLDWNPHVAVYLQGVGLRAYLPKPDWRLEIRMAQASLCLFNQERKAAEAPPSAGAPIAFGKALFSSAVAHVAWTYAGRSVAIPFISAAGPLISVGQVTAVNE